MGAHNAHAYFDGKLSHEALRKEYKKHIDQLLFEYGHDAYNGTLSTCNGLTISDKVFDTEREAEEYGLHNTEKWEAAMAVKSRGIIRRNKPFTFNGKVSTIFTNDRPYEEVIEGDFHRHKYVTRVADQLNKTEGSRLLKLHAAAKVASEAVIPVEGPLHKMIALLTNVEKEVPSTHFSELKRETLKYRKLATKHLKLKAELDAYVAELRTKYCTEIVETGKTMWVVSGWAAC